MDRDQLDAHLQFFGELGVAGFRREPEWRRPSAAQAVVSTQVPESKGHSELPAEAAATPPVEVTTVALFA